MQRRQRACTVGVPSGIPDEATCLFGRSGHAVPFDFASLEHELVALPAGQLALWIADAGVSTCGLEHSGYATRVNRKRDRAVCATWRWRTSECARSSRRCAPKTSRASVSPREGHESLRVDFEVSIPELDRLVEWAYENGFDAARMTAAAWAGCIVALVADDDAAAFAEHMPAPTWISGVRAGARELHNLGSMRTSEHLTALARERRQHSGRGARARRSPDRCARAPTPVTDADVERGEGGWRSEDEIFEQTVAAAISEGPAPLRRGPGGSGEALRRRQRAPAGRGGDARRDPRAQRRGAARRRQDAALPPELFGRPFSEELDGVMRGPSDWSAGERELFAGFTSLLNQCPF